MASWLYYTPVPKLGGLYSRKLYRKYPALKYTLFTNTATKRGENPCVCVQCAETVRSVKSHVT